MHSTRHRTWRGLLATLIVSQTLSTAAVAQESKLEIQAARCSAIFSMLSEAFANDAKRAPAFRHFTVVYNDLYLKEKKERTGNASAEEGKQRRDSLLQEFRQTYSERQAAMKEEVVLCGAWAEGYRSQGDVYTYVPIIPKLIPAAVRDEYEALAVAGWTKWLR